jgi:hypothetical protein
MSEPTRPEGDPHDDPDGPEPHVDPMSEVEAEVDADRPDQVVRRHRVAPDTIGSGPPPNPRVGHQRFLIGYLRVALVAAFLVGVLELVLPEDLRDEAATVMVAILVAAPLGRVVWLAVRWARRRDWRYVAVAGVLLAVVATGFLVR